MFLKLYAKFCSLESKYNIYITYNCTHFVLTGKRMESIQKIMERQFLEASWRQPAVILLDDLDQIAASPTGPEQELTGEALYYTKIAQGTS